MEPLYSFDIKYINSIKYYLDKFKSKQNTIKSNKRLIDIYNSDQPINIKIDLIKKCIDEGGDLCVVDEKTGYNVLMIMCFRIGADIDMINYLFNELFSYYFDKTWRKMLSYSYNTHDLCLDLIKEIYRKQFISKMLNMTDKEGQTALHWSVLQGNILISNLLLNLGSNPNLKDNFGITPINISNNFTLYNSKSNKFISI